MSGFSRFTIPLCLLLNITVAGATPDAHEGADGVSGRPASQVPAVAQCNDYLIAPKIDGAKSLVLVNTDNPLESAMANDPIAIIKADYKGKTKIEREKLQEEKAVEIANVIAKHLLSIQNISDEQANVDATVIIQRLGEVPKGALDSFAGIINKSLSSLEDPAQMPTFQKDTNNALAELTRVVTSYRKNAFDVNWFANLMFKLKLKDQSQYLRTHFQSVRGAAEDIDQTLEAGLAQMYKRHFEMLDARIQLKTLERYAQLCVMIGQHVGEIVDDFMKENEFTDEQRQAMDKNLLVPLTARVAQIVRTRTAVAVLYAKFAALMDGNLSLISVIGNVREMANLEITGFGAAKIIENEQREMLNLANSTMDALDQMRDESIKQLQQNGILLRQLPDKTITSMHKMVEQMNQIEAELVVNADFNRVTVEKFRAVTAEITEEMDKVNARAERGQLNEMPTGNLIDSVDKSIQNVIERNPKAIEERPAVPALAHAA